ncbi:MAG: aminotransferase class I/II-fold pyridoxal phosphate-dependent enzyme [Solirubrobacteraceae bacterium]
MSRFVAPAPGPHGGDGARLASQLGVPAEQVLDLSVSLNPCAPDVVDLVRRHAPMIGRYPDVAPATMALAAAMGVDDSRLVLTNGGAEAIALVAAEFPVGAVDRCDFSLYTRHLARVDAGGRRWRSNPHNPTGRLAERQEHADVWDEAFYPLATGEWSRRDPDAIVLGSLTKVFGCPGLRAGYVLAPDPQLAGRVRARQPQWAVNALTCAVIPELLASADLAAWAEAVARLRAGLESVLRAHGLEPEPSDANFVLVPGCAGVRDHLAASGVLVRDTASFGTPDGARIAVPDAGGLERLAAALEGCPGGS